MTRLFRFFRTAFGFAVLGFLVFAGWALWTAGLFDGAVARDVRTTSVHVADGVAVDETAAERIIGNRRLVVVFEQPGSDLSEVCDDVEDAAEGTVVLMLSQGDDEYDTYGCTLLGGDSARDIGRAFVIESVIADGVDQFTDRPLEALKVVAVNYDQLVHAGLVPDGSREISPSLPRYLTAAAAVAAVVLGAAAIQLAARRAAKFAVLRQEQREATGDARSTLTAGAAVLAQQIIDLDARHSGDKRYRRIIDDYVRLLADIPKASTEAHYTALAGRVDALSERCRKLT